MIRIFLLDDHAIVRKGLRDLFDSEDDMAVVGEASTAEEAISVLSSTEVDVAVLDVRLGDGDGIGVCRDARSLRPGLACVMLTSFADDEALYAAIMAGAAGYVLKDIRTDDLVEGVRRAAAGESLLDPALVQRAVERMRSAPGEDRRLSTLTEQERRVLALIADGMTNRQIAEQLYLAEKTVKNYVSNLLAKLGLSRRTEAAVFALRAEQQVPKAT